MTYELPVKQQLQKESNLTSLYRFFVCLLGLIVPTMRQQTGRPVTENQHCNTMAYQSQLYWLLGLPAERSLATHPRWYRGFYGARSLYAVPAYTSLTGLNAKLYSRWTIRSRLGSSGVVRQHVSMLQTYALFGQC